MTTPKEALERIIQIYERNAGRQNEKLADIPLVARRALASFEGDAVERVARVLCQRRGIDPDWPVGVSADGWHQEPYVKFRPSWDWFHSEDARAILATGLLPDEAAIRADESERCAEIADCMADEYDATSFTSTNADQVAALRSKEQAAHEIAAAIRAGRGEV